MTNTATVNTSNKNTINYVWKKNNDLKTKPETDRQTDRNREDGTERG